MFAWRLLQAVLTFCAIVWLAYEVFRTTGSRWLAIGLLFFVTLSKPSIFWSLKLSREGLHECLTYALIAVFLFACRKRTLIGFFGVGLITAANFLNKPNAILILPFVFAMFVYEYWRERATIQSPVKATFYALSVCALGVVLLWGPWVARSVFLYGEPVLLSTQGPYTLLWEIGAFTVELRDGRTVHTDVNELQRTAARDFATDRDSSKYAWDIAKVWMHDHARQLPSMVLERVRRSVRERDIYLTKVSRDALFDNPVDSLLLDKTVLSVYMGIIGMLLLPVLYRCWPLAFISVAVVIPWLSAAMIVGYPRMLEAALPLILFGNVAWSILGLRWYKSRSAKTEKIS